MRIGDNYARIKCVKLIDNQTFNAALTSYTSSSIRCDAHRYFALLIDLDVTGAPTDIVFSVWFSHDNTTFFKYMNGPFGDLRYEDAAGDKLEAIHGDISGKYVKLTAVATGTGEQALFNVDAILVMMK